MIYVYKKLHCSSNTEKEEDLEGWVAGRPLKGLESIMINLYIVFQYFNTSFDYTSVPDINYEPKSCFPF